MGRPVLAVVLAIALFSPIAVCVYRLAAIEPEAVSRLREPFVKPDCCQPEPAERATFLAGLIVMPLVIIGACRIHRWRIPTDSTSRWIVAGFAACALVAGAIAFWMAVSEDQFFHARRGLLVTRPLWGAAAAAAVLILAISRWATHPATKATCYGLACGIVAFVSAAMVFSENWTYSAHHHFTAVFHPAVQVHAGRTMLVDGFSQYGLYAQFLHPAFEAMGLSVWTFTLVMAVLTAVSYGCLWQFLRRTTSNSIVAVVGFAALVFAHWNYIKTPETGGIEALDLYFQYVPIRLLFPAALLLLATRHFHAPTRRGMLGITAIGAIGVLWNLDAGLPTFGAWIGTLGLNDLFTKPSRRAIPAIIGHLLVGLASVMLAVGAYALFTVLARGEWPRFAEFWQAQQIYYASGFAMLPMPLPGTWMIVITIYLTGLATGLMMAREGGDTANASPTIMASLVGLGLFAYYQGRSHPYVLTLAWWPCFLLLTQFVDRVIIQWRERARHPTAALAGIGGWCVLFSFAGAFFADVPGLSGLIVRQNRSSGNNLVLDYVEPLRAYVSDGTSALYLSTREPLLHLRTATKPLAPRSNVEWLRKEDFHRVIHELENHPNATVYLENQIEGHLGSRILNDWIEARYDLMERTPSGRIFRRAPARERVARNNESQ
jgi:hypothetical protein